MNVKHTKTKLVAAALTLALSVGSAVPAIAAAPTALAAATDIGHGSMMLDTANYVMAPNNIYDIGITVRDGNGNALSATQVRNLVSSGKLTVTDSRNGSVVRLTQLTNGNFRVTARNPGTCYIVYQGGGNHASVKIDVQNGVKQHGKAIRNTSWFTQNIGYSRSGAGGSTGNTGNTGNTGTTSGTRYRDPNGLYTITLPEGYEYIKESNGIPMFGNYDTQERFVIQAQKFPEFSRLTNSQILEVLKRACSQRGDTMTASASKGTGVYIKYSTADNWPYCANYAGASPALLIDIRADNSSILNSVLNSLSV